MPYRAWQFAIVGIGVAVVTHILIQHIIEPRLQRAKGGTVIDTGGRY